MFDYGKEGNLKKYGTEKAPQYNLANVNFYNVHLFVGKYDKLATIQDVKRLYQDLTNAKNKVIFTANLDICGVGFWTCYFYLGEGCYFYSKTC